MVDTGNGGVVVLSEQAAKLRGNWGWLLALGVLLVILGVVALVDATRFTVVSMLFFGWVLVAAGIVEAIQAFRHRDSWYLLVHALNAALAIVVGLILLRNPSVAAVVVTLLLAIYFTAAGVFRIVAALKDRTPGWHWGLISGIAALVLGILVWMQWPEASYWVIGLFIGIELIILGATQIMTALAARKLPAPAH